MNIDMQNAFIAGLASSGLVEQRDPITGSAVAQTFPMIDATSAATLEQISITATANAALTE